MENVSAMRAMLLSDEDALAGNTTLSLETQAELAEDDIFTFLSDNFGAFLRTLRFLKKEDQELLLSYYLLGKAQNTLALIHKSTQTVCSFQIRMAVKTLGTFLMMGGAPSEALLSKVFTQTGYENVLEKAPLSAVVMEYVRTRNFQHVANRFALHRPDVRRAMSKTSKALMESTEPEEAAVAAWLHSLIDKMSPVGTGFSKRKSLKMGSLYRQDPAIVGEFRVNVADADFGKVFVGRANR